MSPPYEFQTLERKRVRVPDGDSRDWYYEVVGAEINDAIGPRFEVSVNFCGLSTETVLEMDPTTARALAKAILSACGDEF